MATANPVNSKVAFKRQTGKGVTATGAGAQYLRRETAMFNLAKDAYDTATEIVSHQQLASVRHGVRLVNGKLSNFFSPGSYADMISAVLRRDFVAVAPATGVALTIAGTGPTYTVTRSAGSYLTDGFKVGMVVRLSAGALNAANISKNLTIASIASATVMTVIPVNSVALVAEGPIAACTITAIGKVTFTPATGQTNIYYTVETWDPDVPSSEMNSDVKISKIDFKLPGAGNTRIDITAVGLNQTPSAAQVFTAPTAEATTGVMVAASGILLVAGVAVGIVTDLSVSVDGAEVPADGSVGSVVRTDIFRGVVKVSGSFTGYFDTRIQADAFINETQQSLIGVFASDSTGTSDFVSLARPIITTTSADTDDGVSKGKKRTYNFTAIYNAAGGAGVATEKTTMQVQDSAA